MASLARQAAAKIRYAKHAITAFDYSRLQAIPDNGHIESYRTTLRPHREQRHMIVCFPLQIRWLIKII